VAYLKHTPVETKKIQNLLVRTAGSRATIWSMNLKNRGSDLTATSHFFSHMSIVFLSTASWVRIRGVKENLQI